MSLANEMRRLTRHFEEAFEDRMAAVAAIHPDTAEQLADFRFAHQAMADELRERLSNDETGHRAEAARLADVDAWIAQARRLGK